MKNLLKQVKESLQERKSALESQMRPKTRGSFTRHNWIVEVGRQTVATNDESKVILKDKVGTNLPTLWDKEGVKEIRLKCRWNTVDGKMIPIKSYFYKDWYKKELEQVNNQLLSLN